MTIALLGVARSRFFEEGVEAISWDGSEIKDFDQRKWIAQLPWENGEDLEIAIRASSTNSTYQNVGLIIIFLPIQLFKKIIFSSRFSKWVKYIIYTIEQYWQINSFKQSFF